MKRSCFVLVLILVSAWSALAVPEMDKLKGIYQAELARLRTETRGERLRMPQEHIAALKDLEMSYQKSGELKSLLAVRSERQRFISDPSVPAIVLVRVPDRLRSLQQSYIERYNGLSSAQETSIDDLRDKYLRALEKLQKDLTRQGKIESALAVMNEIESPESEPTDDEAAGATTDTTSSVPPPVVTPKPSRPAVLDIEALNTLLHGRVVRWNSYSRQITISYDFSDGAQMEDWKGGRLDALRGMLVCDRTVSWARLQMLEISEIKYDAFFDGDEYRAGLVIGTGLQAHLIGSDDSLEAKLFQTSEEHPVVRFTETGSTSARVHHGEFSLNDNRVEWSVDRGRTRSAQLQVPVRYPTYFGFGHMGAVSAYDNIIVTGILSKEYEAYLKQQL